MATILIKRVNGVPKKGALTKGELAIDPQYGNLFCNTNSSGITQIGFPIQNLGTLTSNLELNSGFDYDYEITPAIIFSTPYSINNGATINIFGINDFYNLDGTLITNLPAASTYLGLPMSVTNSGIQQQYYLILIQKF